MKLREESYSPRRRRRDATTAIEVVSRRDRDYDDDRRRRRSRRDCDDDDRDGRSESVPRLPGRLFEARHGRHAPGLKEYRRRSRPRHMTTRTGRRPPNSPMNNPRRLQAPDGQNAEERRHVEASEREDAK